MNGLNTERNFPTDIHHYNVKVVELRSYAPRITVAEKPLNHIKVTILCVKKELCGSAYDKDAS